MLGLLACMCGLFTVVFGFDVVCLFSLYYFMFSLLCCA